tara:strand:- start:553 stop:1185 length:633 start_codon:yes stop_codon:yes gene_type:complete
MALFNRPDDSTSTPTVTPSASKRSPFKWVALSVGGVFAVAHIGLLGYVFNSPKVPEYPVINFPQGDYSSYEVEATKDGYKIKYKANDPTVLESDSSLHLNRHKKGLFGPTTEMRREYRRNQYTMDGVRNLGGAVNGEGKNLATTEECIRADAGARSQGAMAGTAISAGLVVPAVSSIPYIGWLAGGWALLLGQQVGSELGSEIGSSFNDC